ncbi:MAG: L-histidine N(alpha)-methyltransferase [Kangiellaceae bacterium]
MAIKDWKIKKEIVRIAFGQVRQNDVPDQVLDANNFDEERYGFGWDNLLEMYGHRFDKERINVGPNSKYRIFFAELSEQLGCDEVVPGTSLVDGSVTDFLTILPSITREKLNAALTQGGVQLEFREQLTQVLRETSSVGMEPILPDKQELNLFRAVAKSWYPIYYTPGEELPTIKEGLRNGHIDQSLYYQNTDAVNRWLSVTNDEFYTGFDQCKTGLLKLSRQSEWLDFIADQQFDGIAMLCGGGAHSKDAVLIKCLLDVVANRARIVEPQKKIKYTLIDRSSAMLELSRSKIEELLDKRDGHDFIEIKALRRDVMRMNGTEPVRGNGNVAWFNTGGTLGNLDEAQFFESLNQVSKSGDMLILGVGCFENKEQLDLAALAKEYERDVVRDLVAVPLSAVWSTLDVGEKPEEAISSIMVDAVCDTHSSVPNAVTVVAKLPSRSFGEIILFKSSRYDEPELICFAGEFGWELSDSIEGLDASFKQLVFRRG